jgi:tRNA pseudouridine38-40 synthase
MRNIKLLIEYDGTDFVGWQIQANGRSVQGEITKVLDHVLQDHVNLIGSGRTDSGVHARGQVANFHTRSVMELGSIVAALNGLLPDDVCARSAEEVPEEFHARFDARARTYRYYISPRPLSIGRQYHWYVKYSLDLGLMKENAGKILGDHDFESFSKHEAEASHYRCMVVRSGWGATDGTLVYEVTANRFLHGMVRALVGTMVDIGRGYTPGPAFEEIMKAKDRAKAGMAAPSQGLFLEQVEY